MSAILSFSPFFGGQERKKQLKGINLLRIPFQPLCHTGQSSLWFRLKHHHRLFLTITNDIVKNPEKHRVQAVEGFSCCTESREAAANIFFKLIKKTDCWRMWNIFPNFVRVPLGSFRSSNPGIITVARKAEKPKLRSRNQKEKARHCGTKTNKMCHHL